MAKITVKGTEIVFYKQEQEDYISLTDTARHRDSERSDYILQNWLRNRSTIEFIGLWEQFNNSHFNSIEFDGIKNQHSFFYPLGGGFIHFMIWHLLTMLLNIYDFCLFSQ